MVVEEVRQREAKRLFVSDALRRIGRLHGVAVGETRPGGEPLHHRNKVELTFGLDDAMNPILGYHGAGSPGTLIDVASCAIADPRLAPLLERARAYFLSGEGRLDPALVSGPEPVRLVLRASGRTGETLIALRGPDRPFRSAEPFARWAIDSIPGLVGVVRILATPGRRGGTRVLTLAGRPWLEDTLLGSTFHVPAAAFLQVNAVAGEALGRYVVEGAGASPTVLELYGGVGAIGLALARAGAHATIVDADAEAVACGREAAFRAGIDRAEFVSSDVLRFLEREAPGAERHLVVADPPRTGLGRGVARRIAASGARRIAMVSCDPATLARDLAALTALGFEVEGVTPFDVFPQTAHVEAVAWLSRA
jgi:23S rRNA (uracil1939-C5)-methyltransferase